MKLNLRHSGWQLGLAVCALLLISLPYGQHKASAHPVGDGHWVSRERPGRLELVSSIKVTDDVVQKAIQAARSAYSTVLTPFAKVTTEQAKASALQQFSGAAAQDIALQVMRQNLVYVAVVQKGAQRHLVIVDAGNGRVLATREFPVRHHTMNRALAQ